MIPLFIPYVNRPDLLDRAMVSIPRVDGIEVAVINNSASEHVHVPMGMCMTPRKGMTFSETQNLMLRTAQFMQAPFYFFMHSDAEAAPGTVLRLFEMAHLQQEKWGAIFTNYDSLAAFNTEAFDAIGGWDDNLPWYLSDCDIYRRMRLAGYPTIDSGLPVKHTPSQTLNSDPEIKRKVEEQTAGWQAYYEKKWGGPNERETFLTPFNQ